MVREALGDETSAAADIVSLNAGAAIYVAGVAETLRDGVVMAKDAIASGLANERLEELVATSSLMAEQKSESNDL